MKRDKSYLLVCTIFLAGLTFSGCSMFVQEKETVPVQEAQPVAEAAVDIKTGVQAVVTEVQTMEKRLEQEVRQTEVRQFGRTLAEKWDQCETEIEKQYPQQYEKIEQHLYPLIAETGKQEINIQKVRSLVEQTHQDLQAFLEMLPK